MMGRKGWTALAAALMLGGAVGTAGQPAKPAAPEVPEGYRKVVLEVSASEAAFVEKDDRVDVLVVFDAKMTDKSLEKVAATILQNVRVTDFRRGAKLDDKAAVQLLVDQHEAQYLALGQALGSLRLAVRGAGDKAMKPMEMASFRKLFR